MPTPAELAVLTAECAALTAIAAVKAAEAATAMAEAAAKCAEAEQCLEQTEPVPEPAPLPTASQMRIRSVRLNSAAAANRRFCDLVVR